MRHIRDGRHRTLQDWHRGGASVGVRPRHPFQQQVDRIGSPGARGEVFDGSTDLEEDPSLTEIGGGVRGCVRGQVGLPREVKVQRFELSRSFEQERSGVVSVAKDECDVATQQAHTSTPEPVESSCLGGRRELKGRVEVASLEASFRGIYRPL